VAVLGCRRRILAGPIKVSKAFLPRLAALGRRGLLLLPLTVCAFLFRQSLAAQPQGLTEQQIKAGFLFNFTKFVEWPAGAFADASSPIILGFVDDNEFGSLLTEVTAGKSVNGRAVVVKQFKEGQDPRDCQILFVGATDRKHLEQALDKLKGAAVLTVGDGSEFTQSGGMIAFLVEQNKVRLELDLAAATQARLKISAKLIAVARLVTPKARGKN
jgi:YfiR/HmsC-like